MSTHIVRPNPVVAVLAKKFYTRIPLDTFANVLDFGCRDGRVTYALAEQFPNLNIVAVDRTEEFIQSAKSAPQFEKFKDRVQFLSTDYNDIQSRGEFDAVVSFSCVNWLPAEGKRVAYKKIQEILKPGGQAFLQMFLDHGRRRFDTCVHAVADREEWKTYFNDLPASPCRTKFSDHLKYIEEADLLFESATTRTYSHTFEAREGFIQFISSWSSHARYLPENLREKFLNQVIDQHGSLTYTDYVMELVLSRS